MAELTQSAVRASNARRAAAQPRTSAAPLADELIVHAPNVHHGGARTLLIALLEALPAEVRGHLLTDRRCQLPARLPEGFRVWRFAPTIAGRLRAEWRLRQLATHRTRTLCFGNLPPLVRVAGHVSVFLHNWYLVGPANLSQFSAAKRWQTRLERRWLRHALSHADEVIVQTETMRHHVSKLCLLNVPMRVMPFVSQNWLASEPNGSDSKQYDFVYVSSAYPHKNHALLFHAWTLLADEGLFPSLAVTIGREDILASLAGRIEQLSAQRGLRIENLGHVPHAQTASLYRRSRCLVFPSLLESFGLPLIEARQHGLTIVAPELDYVRDVVNPDQTFDPHSPRSLARAVKRAMGINATPHPVVSANTFVQSWLASPQDESVTPGR